MKVHELIHQLEKYPAGAEVFISLPGVMNARVEEVSLYDKHEVVVEADDAELVDDEGTYQAHTSAAGQILRDCECTCNEGV